MMISSLCPGDQTQVKQILNMCQQYNFSHVNRSWKYRLYNPLPVLIEDSEVRLTRVTESRSKTFNSNNKIVKEQKILDHSETDNSESWTKSCSSYYKSWQKWWKWTRPSPNSRIGVWEVAHNFKNQQSRQLKNDGCYAVATCTRSLSMNTQITVAIAILISRWKVVSCEKVCEIIDNHWFNACETGDVYGYMCDCDEKHEFMMRVVARGKILPPTSSDW